MNCVPPNRACVGLFAAAACWLALAGVADAATSEPVWTCRASAGYTVVNDGDRAETIVANGNVNTAHGADPDRAQCSSGEAGAGNLPAPIGIPTDQLAARTASASTSITPELGDSRDQRVGAAGRVEGLSLQLPAGGVVLLGATVAQSSATGHCDGATPKLEGTSNVTGLTVNGMPVDAGGLGSALTALLAPLQPLVTVTQNETIRTGDTLTVRALHIVVRLSSGAVLDDVVAESKVGADGHVCGPATRALLCPRGSIYAPESNHCVIPPFGSDGAIDIGRPQDSATGGLVLGLHRALSRYGNSPCLSGPGSNYAIVGGKGADTLRGTKRGDRMLGLGGGDRVDGTGGRDCIDGGPGRDHLSGDLGDDVLYGGRGDDTMSGDFGNDRIHGGAGRDHLNGGSGNDRLFGGAGADTINAGFGADAVWGQSGDDAISIGTAGPPARADCGRGTDKIRLNHRELHRVRNCERVYDLRDP
jgi:Ca2+-binding RTX toxin-like protein